MNYIKLSLVILFVSFPNVVKANNFEFFHQAIDVYKQRIYPLLLGQMTKSEREIISNLEIIIVDKPHLVTLAGTVKEDKKVYISVGFMDGIYNYADCLLLEGQFKKNDICNSYFSYYFQHIGSLNKNPPLPVANFAFRNKEDDVKGWIDNKELDSARKAMFLSALINVFMHEYGHHIKGFHEKGTSVSDMRNLEAKVDEWGYSTLQKMNQKPILGAVVSLGYLSEMERFREELLKRHKNDPHFQLSESEHPKPIQRARIAFDFSCKNPHDGNDIKNSCSFLSKLIDSFD